MRRKYKGLLPPLSWLLANGYSDLVDIKNRRPEAFAHIPQARCRKRLLEHVKDAEHFVREHGTLPTGFWFLKHGQPALAAMLWKYPGAFAHLPQHPQRGRSLAECVREAEELARANGGKLPAQLIRIGKEHIYRALRKHPSAFAHLHQAPRRKELLAAYIQDAERLAKIHGHVPGFRWLANHGRKNLFEAMKDHPNHFAHLPRASRSTRHAATVAKYVREAEQLARKHGKLPNYQWLMQHGHRQLCTVIQKNRSTFAHIVQVRAHKSVTEHVHIAKRLAAKHGGKLPNSWWLTTHGFSSLSEAMRRRPKLFAGIPQEKKKRTPQEWVAIAKRLVAKHGGKLPNSGWLTTHGFAGLYGIMRKRPRLFAGIVQEKKRRWRREWVPIARSLAKKHGGKLPNPKWLTTHGFDGLRYAMRRQPRLFVEIPQLRLRPSRKLK
jgi:hypothetical protein